MPLPAQADVKDVTDELLQVAAADVTQPPVQECYRVLLPERMLPKVETARNDPRFV